MSTLIFKVYNSGIKIFSPLIIDVCKKLMKYFGYFSLTDVPGAPEDISVHDIFQDSCVLKWKKPKDDGGMPIVNYIIERQDLSVKGECDFCGR